MKLLKLDPRHSLLVGSAPLVMALCLFAPAKAGAQSVALAWDPSPDAGVASYRVHYGPDSSSYTTFTNAGTATNLTVQGLSEGNTYYFAVTAIGTNQLESDFSNEISYSVPLPQNTAPTITVIGSQTVNEDASTSAIGFSVGDDQSSAGDLSLTGSSSNPGVVPNGNIVFGGSGESRTVTVTPASNASGSALITVNVSDGELSATRQFTLNVISVNDAPTLAAITDVSAAQNANEQTINLNGISSGAANENQTLVMTASSSNPTLFSLLDIDYSSPASTGRLRFTPAAGQSGTAQVTVTVTDDGGTANGGVNSVQRSFALNVIVSDNLPPTLNEISDMTVVQAEGEPGLNLGAMGAGATIWAVAPGGAAQTQTVNLQGIGTGGESSQSLNVTASSSNPSLVSDPLVTYSSPSSTGSLRFTPAVGRTGSSVITVTVKDDGGGLDTVQKSFTVNVNAPANSAPALTAIGSQNLNEDDVLGPVGFSVSDAQTSAGSLQVTAASGNSTLIADAALQLGGTSGSRTIQVTPVANQSGKALITLSVTDGGGAMAHRSFWVTVNPVNDAPTLSVPSDMTLPGDAPETISLSGIGVGPLDGIQAMTVQASSSNPSIIPDPEVVYYSPNNTAEMQLAPAAGASGSATITVRVRDDGGTANGGQDAITRTFTVTTAPQVASASAPVETVVGATGASLSIPQPTLQINVDQDRVVLTWDGAAGPYVVERSTGLNSESTWNTLNTQPVSAGGSMLKVTLQPENSVEFFRLARQ